MADPRVFTLIGNFTDNITPALTKINKSLEQVKANLESVSKVTKPLKSDFKDLAEFSNKFNSSLKGQASDIRDITTAMRSMRNEMGRVNSAYRAASRNRNIVSPSKLPRAPRTSQYYSTPNQPTVRPSRQGKESYAAAAGGFVAGSQIADMITGSVVRGFQLGVDIMVKPFQYAANAFGERIKDELSDIQSAGGLFATDLRYNLKMFRNFNEARREQENINMRLAQSAAALPGETAQYVREAKRITDTMIGAMGRSQGAFMKYAETLGAKQGDKMDALATVIQKFTEKSVLLGMQPGGGQAGSRMYGVPQLLEMLVNMPKANLKSMSYRYASLRDNPLLANALQQGEAQINATAAGTAERLTAIMKVLDQALPNEVISAMRNSMDGVIQTFKSAFVDPEVGLFGLGRKLNNLVVPRVDALGRYLDNSGKVVENVNLAFKEQTSLYGLFRDTIAGFAVPLTDLVSILPQIYDPLRAIGVDMVEFRNIAQRFLNTFNGFTKGFENLAQLKGMPEIKKTAGLRGSLLSIANLLQNVGKIDTTKFKDYSQKLQQKDVDFAGIAKSLFTDLFDSKFMKMLGEVVGKVIGGTIKMVGDLMAGVTDMANAGPLAKGLKQGWDESGGSQGVANIFKSLFKLIGSLITTAFKAAPLESTILASLTVGLPLLSGLIASGITSLFEMLFKKVTGIANGPTSGAIAGRGNRGGFFQTRRMAARQRLLSYRARETAGFGAELAGLGYNAAGRPGSRMLGSIGKIGRGVGKVIPGGAVAAGAIDLATSMASGESFGKAAVGAFGTVLGGAAGSVFGPVGTVIGSIAGGMLADAASDFVTTTLDQNKAAAMQMDAARKQVEAAATAAQTKYGPDFGAKLGGVEALNQALGGGAGVKAYADEQLRLGKITGEQYQNWAMLSKQLANVNTTTERVDRAQKAYDTAVRLNTGQQEKYKRILEAAQSEQKSALSRITLNWEAMSATSRTKLLSGADSIRAALDEAAAKIRGWKGLPLLTPAPPSPLPSPTPPTTNIPSDRKNLPPAGLDSQKLIPGAPATPESGWGIRAKGGLGDAIAKEMRMKPPGSNLVIANSSETVIPAAGGLGMQALIDTMKLGWGTVKKQYQTVTGSLDSLNIQLRGYTNAMDLQRSMTLGSVKVSAITGNSAEGYEGGPVTVNNNITIHQQPGQDSDELASIVALKIGEAVAQARSASVFV